MMENNIFWKLQDLFHQYECLEEIKYDYVNSKIINKGLKKIRKDIEQLIIFMEEDNNNES